MEKGLFLRVFSCHWFRAGAALEIPFEDLFIFSELWNAGCPNDDINDMPFNLYQIEYKHAKHGTGVGKRDRGKNTERIGICSELLAFLSWLSRHLILCTSIKFSFHL